MNPTYTQAHSLTLSQGLSHTQAQAEERAQAISNFTPVGAAVQAIGQSMQGAFPSVTSLLVMAAYAALLGFVAVRYFRWE